jgi:hypothetical protein
MMIRARTRSIFSRLHKPARSTEVPALSVSSIQALLGCPRHLVLANGRQYKQQGRSARSIGKGRMERKSKRRYVFLETGCEGGESVDIGGVGWKGVWIMVKGCHLLDRRGQHGWS